MNELHIALPNSIVTACLVVLLAGCTATATPTVLPTPSPTLSPTSTAIPLATYTAIVQPGDIFERNSRLGRGINLGNALEAPKEGDWGVTLEESDFQLIHKAGFNSVRVPIKWAAHAAESAPYTIDTSFLERIDWVVSQSFANNLAVILDMHNYDELTSEPDKNTDRFIALWKQIAEHYRKYPGDLYFELLNEPHDMDADTWNNLIEKAISVIRVTNPIRPIITGPVDWYSIRRLADLKLPTSDRNLIVSFHYYLPFQFTHQGAEWVQGSGAWLGTKWLGTSSDKTMVDFDLDRVASWGKENNRPIYMGEFGAYSKADMGSRVNWTAYVARSAEARGFSWAYWEFRSGFGAYDSAIHQWRDRLKDVLVPRV